MSKQLTVEQAQALIDYAKENGRRWKSQLNHAWMTGGTTGALQIVRNAFGPSWLVRFSLKHAESIVAAAAISKPLE